MIDNLDKYIQNFLNQSEEVRLQQAVDATKEIGVYLSSCGFNEKEALNFYLNIIRLFVSADCNCGETEYLLFKKILCVEIPYETFFEMTNGGSTPQFADAMDEIIDQMKQEIKLKVVVLGLAILSSDGIVKTEERELLKKILD